MRVTVYIIFPPLNCLKISGEWNSLSTISFSSSNGVPIQLELDAVNSFGKKNSVFENVVVQISLDFLEFLSLMCFALGHLNFWVIWYLKFENFSEMQNTIISKISSSCKCAAGGYNILINSKIFEMEGNTKHIDGELDICNSLNILSKSSRRSTITFNNDLFKSIWISVSLISTCSQH